MIGHLSIRNFEIRLLGQDCKQFVFQQAILTKSIYLDSLFLLACPFSCNKCDANTEGVMECTECTDTYSINSLQCSGKTHLKFGITGKRGQIHVHRFGVSCLNILSLFHKVCPANCNGCDYDSGTMRCSNCAAKNTIVEGNCQSKSS